MGTLFELVDDMQMLYEMATDPECDPQALADTIDGVMGAIETKAGGYVNVIKQLSMEADECKKVIDAFTAKKKARENAVARMKEAILNAMDIAGEDALKAGDYTIKIAKNGGVQPLKINEGEVPDKFMKVIYEPDKDKIREALKNGEELSFAHLEERGRHLNIK